MNIKRLLIIITCILFLQSCGLKFWYNRLDWVVAWRADDYVELTDEQEENLEALVREKLEWHRSTELPRYVALITELEADLGTENVANKYDYYQDQFIDFYRTSAQKLVPELIELVAELDDEQVQELVKNLNDTANKREQKIKKRTPKKHLKEVKENIADGLEDWSGKLKKSQKALISQWVNEMQSTTELRFSYGNQWRVALEYALAERKNIAGKETLKELILNPSSLQSAELKSRNEINQALEKRYILMLHETMTKKQKKRFLRKLKSYREDFQELIDD